MSEEGKLKGGNTGFERLKQWNDNQDEHFTEGILTDKHEKIG